MKKIKSLLIIMFFLSLLYSVYADSNKLANKTIVIDAGHGGKDVGTSYKDIYEKDINLIIAKILEQKLNRKNVKIILTRSGDYDLSKPNASRRKKSDFDNRIILINESHADLYLSIHLNFFNDSRYKGAQVFYNKDNKKLADIIQKNLNKDRKSKKIDNTLYMYNKLNIPGVLIECGFLSNYYDRNNLLNKDYLEKLADGIINSIIEFYN